jgi:hypothetical protein
MKKMSPELSRAYPVLWKWANRLLPGRVRTLADEAFAVLDFYNYHGEDLGRLIGVVQDSSGMLGTKPGDSCIKSAADWLEDYAEAWKKSNEATITRLQHDLFRGVAIDHEHESRILEALDGKVRFVSTPINAQSAPGTFKGDYRGYCCKDKEGKE